jgi:hypothetical protein
LGTSPIAPASNERIAATHNDGLTNHLTATKSAWSKHLKPILRRAPIVQQPTEAGRCKQTVASVVHAQHNLNLADSNYVNKYVRGASRTHTDTNNNGTAFKATSKQPVAPSTSTHLNNPDKYQSTDETTTSTNDGTLVSNPDSDIRTLNTRLQRATYLQQTQRPRQESPAKQQQQIGAAELQYKKHQLSRRAHLGQ